MKPVLVDACNHFDFGKSQCAKCGRSLPDVCLEFEQMKQKAEAYEKLTDKIDRPSVSESSPERAALGSSDLPVDSIEAPQEPKKARGRPSRNGVPTRKVTE